MRAGHWAVPLMAFENVPFFGRDRFETLTWRMAQRGLKRRDESFFAKLVRRI